MKLIIKEGKNIFENTYKELTMEDMRDLVKSFMTIYKIQTCEWTLTGNGSFGESEGLDALFG